ncbi:hypothetical protein J6590_032707 [Homalodisca vitripennis]|nr:hypothetical protein J6590_032707 [Homalodisca vitripennis]
MSQMWRSRGQDETYWLISSPKCALTPSHIRLFISEGDKISLQTSSFSGCAVLTRRSDVGGREVLIKRTVLYLYITKSGYNILINIPDSRIQIDPYRFNQDMSTEESELFSLHTLLDQV